MELPTINTVPIRIKICLDAKFPIKNQELMSAQPPRTPSASVLSNYETFVYGIIVFINPDWHVQKQTVSRSFEKACDITSSY